MEKANRNFFPLAAALAVLSLPGFGQSAHGLELLSTPSELTADDGNTDRLGSGRNVFQGAPPPAALTVNKSWRGRPALPRDTNSTALLTVQAVGGGVVIQNSSQPVLVYDDSSDFSGSSYSSATEFGDQISPVFGTNALVTQFQFEYFGNLTPALGKTARIRFYANDGPDGAPGTLLLAGSPFPLAANFNSVTISDIQFTAPANGTLTWTVEFAGLAANESASLNIYENPSLGTSNNDFWQKDSSGAWKLEQLSGGSPKANFGARLFANQGVIATSPTSYPVSAVVTLTAVPNPGSAFAAWSGDASGTNNPLTLTLTNDQSVTATFVSSPTEPPTIALQPQDQTVTLGGLATFAVTVATNSPTPWSFQWRLNGTILSGATSPTLTIFNAQTNAAGAYQVVVSNPFGGVLSARATLTVNTPVTIVTQPASQTAVLGGTAILSVTATGSAPLTYQWQLNGVNLAGENAASLALNDVGPIDVGAYKVIVGNVVGTVTSAAATLTVVPGLTLAQALGATNLFWRVGGDASWFVETNVTHNGQAAAQSGAIRDSQNSWIEATVSGPGTLTYWWKVSSELGFDRINFSINGTNQASLSGEMDWQSASFTVPAGAQTLRWNYAKDGSGSGGQDRAWLSEVTYAATGAAPQPVYLVAEPRFGYRLFEMTLNGAAGATYTIQSSPDLIHWSALTNFTTTALSTSIFDPGASNATQRFYRAVSF